MSYAVWDDVFLHGVAEKLTAALQLKKPCSLVLLDTLILTYNPTVKSLSTSDNTCTH